MAQGKKAMRKQRDRREDDSRVRVYKRKGTWYFDVQVLGGRRIRRAGGGTRAEAKRAGAKLLDGLTEEGLSLQGAFSNYLEHIRANGRPTSLKSARGALVAILEHLDATMPIAELTVSDVRALLSALEAQGTEYTAYHAARYLKAALRRAVKDGLQDTVPCYIPVRVPEPVVERAALSRDELESLLDAAPWNLRPILFLAARAGLRNSEIRSRTWRDFDPRKRTLRIAAQPAADFRPKARGSRRVVHLSTKLVETLESYRHSVEADLGRPVKPDDWMFWRQLGSARPWEVTALCGAIRQVFEDAGLSDVPGAGLHCLRRTWATDALAVGNSLAAVQHAGGWSTAQVLLSHYAKPRQAELSTETR